jgi:hypothetical protein
LQHPSKIAIAKMLFRDFTVVAPLKTHSPVGLFSGTGTIRLNFDGKHADQHGTTDQCLSCG